MVALFEAINDTFNLKESTNKLDGMRFVEVVRKDIISQKYYKQYNLVKRKGLNSRKNFIFACSFKSKKAPDIRLSNHKTQLFYHFILQQW